MKKANEYVKGLEEKYEELQKNYLYQHGYVEKVISKEPKAGYIYDPTLEEYYQSVPVNDEKVEIERIIDLDQKCRRLKNYHGFVSIFKGLTVVNFLFTFIFSIYLWYEETFFVFLISFYVGLLLSTILFGIAKLMEMVNEK